MPRSAVILIAAAGLVACTVRTPIDGKFANGEPITGMAVATLESGTVEVGSENGSVSCKGTYNSLSRARELSIPLDCNNGVTGMAQVHRDEGLMSGEGTFELSNGREGAFTFDAEK